MVETGSYPDFITIDGGEGGTGAAPMEYSNSVGMPLRDALAFANRLEKYSNPHIRPLWRDAWEAKESAQRHRSHDHPSGFRLTCGR